MKNVAVAFILIMFGVLYLAVPRKALHEEDSYRQASLIVNSSLVDTEINICEDLAVLPLIRILDELGATINSVDGNELKVIYDNRAFLLNVENQTLIEEGNTINLLMPVPGSKCFICKVSNDDILMDDLSLKITLQCMGINVYVHHRTNEAIVEIITQNS